MRPHQLLGMDPERRTNTPPTSSSGTVRPSITHCRSSPTVSVQIQPPGREILGRAEPGVGPAGDQTGGDLVVAAADDDDHSGGGVCSFAFLVALLAFLVVFLAAFFALEAPLAVLGRSMSFLSVG